MFVRESVMLGGKPLTLETGRLAKQADASVLVTYGETQVLVTLCHGEPRPGIDFFPLTCDFVEKTYSAGKIPGGFFKREARQRDAEIVTCRLMDRPVRPLFPDGFKKETQLIALVLSYDKENRGDVLAMTGASAALHISELPWDGPIIGIRVGRVDGEFVANPTLKQVEEADMEIIVACSRDAIVMVEGGGDEFTEKDLADALEFAHESAQPVLELIEELRAVVGKPKMDFTAPALDDGFKKKVSGLLRGKMLDTSLIKEKHERYDAYDGLKKHMLESMKSDLGEDTYKEHEGLIKAEFGNVKYDVVRGYVLAEKKRIDGRTGSQIRPISVDPGVLPRTHGSALFQRGETQGLATTTLGTSADEQKMDALEGQSWKRFYLHYNFPPFCVGETRFLRGPSRREIGHGTLAERALARVMPSKEDFPYTVRVVSETLESNGSSSMAAVCGGCVSLMDAGVPIKTPVAGVAMGLISDGDRYIILSDILGDEDHLGDMDFKVCGSEKGITAIQMDIKIKGLSREIMMEALEQARDGRLHILDKMLEALPAPRPELSKHAPRIVSIKVKPEQIRVIIGPGGKTIRGIVDQTGATIDVEDDGTVNIASSDGDALRRAMDIIEGLIAEPEVGKVYDGIVRRVVDFGCFVEILPNRDGLVHISELAHGRTERVEDVAKEGDALKVKVLSVDHDGKVRLSHRETLPPPAEGEEVVHDDRGPRGDSRGGPPRGGDRGRGGPRGGDRGRGGPRGDSRGRGGPRGDSRGPRGDSRGGPRGDSRGPRGDSRGPRGDSRGGPREDSRGGDSRGGDSRGGDSRGGDSPGGESRGGESRGGDSRGGESRGGESRGGESRGGDSRGGEGARRPRQGGSRSTGGGDTPGGGDRDRD